MPPAELRAQLLLRIDESRDEELLLFLHPFLLEAGLYSGLKDDGLEFARQVVFGAQLDAARYDLRVLEGGKMTIAWTPLRPSSARMRSSSW